MLADDIRALSDDDARRLLATIARALRPDASTDPGEEAAMTEALADALGAAPSPASEGELARRALLVLADDPAQQEPLAVLIQGPTAERFAIEPTTALLITGVLLVLQTHVLFERDKDGKFRVKIEKKPTSDALLRPLVSGLLSLLPRRGPRP